MKHNLQFILKQTFIHLKTKTSYKKVLCSNQKLEFIKERKVYGIMVEQMQF